MHATKGSCAMAMLKSDDDEVVFLCCPGCFYAVLGPCQHGMSEAIAGCFSMGPQRTLGLYSAQTRGSGVPPIPLPLHIIVRPDAVNKPPRMCSASGRGPGGFVTDHDHARLSVPTSVEHPMR